MKTPQSLLNAQPVIQNVRPVKLIVNVQPVVKTEKVQKNVNVKPDSGKMMENVNHVPINVKLAPNLPKNVISVSEKEPVMIVNAQVVNTKRKVMNLENVIHVLGNVPNVLDLLTTVLLAEVTESTQINVNVHLKLSNP